MLSLSQTTGYSILALACLGEIHDEWVKAREIGACTGIPTSYLSQIMHRLGKVGIVDAKRGTSGGYALAFPAKKINLLQIAEAVEGESWSPKCLLGFADCSDKRACPTHEFWSKLRGRIEAKLARTTLDEVARFERRRKGRLGAACKSRAARKSRR